MNSIIENILTRRSVRAYKEDHIVYGSVVLGYAAGEIKPAAPRKDVINIIR